MWINTLNNVEYFFFNDLTGMLLKLHQEMTLKNSETQLFSHGVECRDFYTVHMSFFWPNGKQMKWQKNSITVSHTP